MKKKLLRCFHRKETLKVWRIMRLLTIFSFCFAMTVSASIYSQNTKLNLDLKNATLREILDYVEQNSDFIFLYKNEEVDIDKKMDINLQNASIDEVLKELLSDQNLTYKVLGRQVIITTPETGRLDLATGQSVVNIKGKVTDSSGIPLPGVTVVIKGTTQGIITDADGKYSLVKVPTDATLVFSFVGMKSQEIKVAGKTTIDVVMVEETIGIEEVVTIGFGTQKKVNLTGAVGTVSSEDLQNRPVQNAVQALQGMAAGLNIQQTSGFLDATPEINIRGTGNLGTGSSAAPLVLIDGVEGSLKNVNPQDIENVSILKDAAASSIYGSRAPFGVILITTKKGDAKQIKVSYSNNFRWGAPIVQPKTMDSYTFATFMNDAADNANRGRYINDERLQRIKDYQEGRITTVSVPDPSNPTIWANGNSYGNANVDAYDVYYKDWAFSQEHNVNASGGNDRFTFYMGLGYLDKSGLLEIADDIYRRYSPTGTIEAQMTAWMKLRYTARFIRTDYNRPTDLVPGMYINLARQSWPFLPVYDDNGYYYPANSPMLGIIEGGRTNAQTDNFNNHGSLVMEPVKNWVTTVEFNYNINTYTKNAVSLKTYIHDVAGNPMVKRETSYVSNDYNKNNFLNLNVYSSYNFSLDHVHNFKIMAGAQLEDLKYKVFGLSRVGVIVDDLPVVDLTSGLNNNGSAATPSVYGRISEWNTAGYFGRLNYDYQGKYMLEANLRYDGTSRFRRETRWNWFPSFSAGWNIARENFWGELGNTVNTLKLRGSYGELGNQNINSWYPTYQVISVNASSGSWLQNGVMPNTASSPALISSSLTWEKINTWDVGVDVGAFNNRLSGSFDYYVRKTLDMVGPAMELPNILGKSVPKSNNTDLKTYGFELELDWHDRLDNGISYGIRFMLSDYQTEITRYPNDKKLLSTYYEGQKLGNIWGYETIGIAKSDEEMEAHLASLPNGGQSTLGSNWLAGDIMYRDLNGDGKINTGSNTLEDHGDLKIIGNSTPRYQFGVDLNAKWKGFDLRIFFQGVGKRDFWTNSSKFFGCSYTGQWQIIGLKEHVDYFRLESSNDLPANIDAYYPRPLLAGAGKNQQTQTRYLQNAAYIRLKNLSLGYTIPQHITQKFYVNGLRLFISGENIWTGTKTATMFDPEAIDAATSYTTGDYYPLEKTLSFGLTVTF